MCFFPTLMQRIHGFSLLEGTGIQHFFCYLPYQTYICMPQNGKCKKIYIYILVLITNVMHLCSFLLLWCQRQNIDINSHEQNNTSTKINVFPHTHTWWMKMDEKGVARPIKIYHSSLHDKTCFVTRVVN